jgi:hypothetical protein
MKKIDLPIERSFVTQALDLHEALKDLSSGKKTIVPIGTIDFSTGKDLDQARTNGGLIIWSAICLEQKLESVIAKYMFPYTEQSNENRGRDFFLSRIIKADHFSYAVKKALVIDIVSENSLLEGRDKDGLTKNVKKAMDYRNMFAHGNIIFEENKGCVLHYWSGGSKQDVLTDDYWVSLEKCFESAHALVDQVLAKL